MKKLVQKVLNLAIIAALSGFFVFNVALALNRQEINSQIIAKINSRRVAAGLDQLAHADVIDKAAASKMEDMAANNYFDHISPNGKRAKDFLSRSGNLYFLNGENLARGYDHPEDVVGAWMESPSHRENILDFRFKEIGVASGEFMVNGQSNKYYVLIMAAPAGSQNTAVTSGKTGFNFDVNNLTNLSWPLGVSVALILLFFGLDSFFVERIYEEEKDPLHINRDK